MRQSLLRTLLPKAGMIYPFDRTLMKRARGDSAVVSALKKGLNTTTLTSSLLDAELAAIFHEATTLLLQQQQSTVGSHAPSSSRSTYLTANPILFMSVLRTAPALHAVWTRRTADLFTSLFLVLRAARQNWFACPRPPFEMERHCRVARAVDGFLAVDSLNWGGATFVDWLLRGGLDVVHRGEDGGGEVQVYSEVSKVLERQTESYRGNEGSDSEGEDLKVKVCQHGLALPVSVAEAVGEVWDGEVDMADAAAGDRDISAMDIDIAVLTFDMRCLHIEVDDVVLANAVGNLSLERRAKRPHRIGGLAVQPDLGGSDSSSDIEMS